MIGACFAAAALLVTSDAGTADETRASDAAPDGQPSAASSSSSAAPVQQPLPAQPRAGPGVVAATPGFPRSDSVASAATVATSVDFSRSPYWEQMQRPRQPQAAVQYAPVRLAGVAASSSAAPAASAPTPRISGMASAAMPPALATPTASATAAADLPEMCRLCFDTVVPGAPPLRQTCTRSDCRFVGCDTCLQRLHRLRLPCPGCRHAELAPATPLPPMTAVPPTNPNHYLQDSLNAEQYMTQFGPLRERLGTDARPDRWNRRTQPGPTGEWLTFDQMNERYGAAGSWHWLRSSDHLRGYTPVSGEERQRRLSEYLRNAVGGGNEAALGVVPIPLHNPFRRRASYGNVRIPPEYLAEGGYTWSEDDAAVTMLRMYEELSGVLWAPLGPYGPPGSPVAYNPEPRDNMVMALPPTERLPVLRWERDALNRARYYDWARRNPVRATFAGIRTQEDLQGFFESESSSSEDEADEGPNAATTMEEYSARRLKVIRRMINTTYDQLKRHQLWRDVTPEQRAQDRAVQARTKHDRDRRYFLHTTAGSMGPPVRPTLGPVRE